VGFWAATFFAMLPACIGNEKMCKPHMWGGALSLWALFYCFKARASASSKSYLVAAFFFGLAVGVSTPQILFLPFLLWASWSGEPRSMARRVFLSFGIVAALYFLGNFYIFAHLQDYKDELYYANLGCPFRITGKAIWNFCGKSLFVTYGPVLFFVVLAGTLAGAFQKKDLNLRISIGLALVCVLIMAFESQSLDGDPRAIRTWLALAGLGCLAAAWLTERLAWGAALRWLCFACLLAEGILYDLHFASDRVPFDNASLAAKWINENVPPDTPIVQVLPVPHVSAFPPIDFTRYKIVTFDSAECKNLQLPAIAVISSLEPGTMDTARRYHFVFLKRFAASPLQRLGLQDPFSTADFPLDIYRRN